MTGVFQDYIARSEDSSAWQCTICGKESAQKVNLVKHVESVHFPDSFSHGCKYCGQTFNTKDKLYKHVQRYHKNWINVIRWLYWTSCNWNITGGGYSMTWNITASFIYLSESLTLASGICFPNRFGSRNAFHGFIDTDTSSYNTVENKDRGAKWIFKKWNPIGFLYYL